MPERGETVEPRSRGREAIVAMVARGAVLDDPVFDALYPRTVRRSSRRHWTPLRVAARALDLLELDEESRVLDVGSGAGKFCLIGALRTRAHFVGVEQRAPLVKLSRAIARRFGVERATYRLGTAEDLDWTEFDRFYFYNPFGEHELAAAEQIPFPADLTRERALRRVRVARRKLESLPPGARVVTYHGIGAPMPAGYRRAAVEIWDDGLLECWVRDDDPRFGGGGVDPLEDLALTFRPRRGRS